MQSRWVRWVAYMLLAALVVVTSCQAMADAAGTAELPSIADEAGG